MLKKRQPLNLFYNRFYLLHSDFNNNLRKCQINDDTSLGMSTSDTDNCLSVTPFPVKEREVSRYARKVFPLTGHRRAGDHSLSHHF